METNLRTKYHNPDINEDDEVISQYLDDEAFGWSIDIVNTGRYRLKEIGEIVKLVSEAGEIIKMDLVLFMREGILGEERFTVVRNLNLDRESLGPSDDTDPYPSW